MPITTKWVLIITVPANSSQLRHKIPTMRAIRKNTCEVFASQSRNAAPGSPNSDVVCRSAGPSILNRDIKFQSMHIT